MTEVPVRLHVYFGVCSRQGMPYRALLEDMAAKGQIRLTVVESANTTKERTSFMSNMPSSVTLKLFLPTRKRILFLLLVGGIKCWMKYHWKVNSVYSTCCQYLIEKDQLCKHHHTTYVLHTIAERVNGPSTTT